MVFKRRVPRSALHQIRELFWPSMGWRRTLRYFKYRLIRLQDSPARISRGVACGVAISFTPIPGTHFIQAFIAARMLKANVAASIISTFAGNPWTFAPMWYLSYIVGAGFFHWFGWHTAELPPQFGFGDLWRAVWAQPFQLMVPWVVGGYLCAGVAGPLTYMAINPMIHRHRRVRQRPHHPARGRA